MGQLLDMESPAKKKVWENDAFFLLTFWSMFFFNYSGRTIFPPILPIIEKELTIGHAAAGGISTFIYFGYGIGLILAGPLIRRFNTRTLILAGHGGLILFLGLFSLGEKYYFFAACSFLLGFGAGLYIPCAIPLLTRRFSSSHWAKMIGAHGTAPSISLLVVPILIAFLLEIFSWEIILLFFSLFGIIPLLAFGKIRSNYKSPISSVSPTYSSLLKDKRIWAIGILQCVASGVNLGLYAVIPLYLVSERGFTLFGANQLLGMSRIGGVVVPLVAGAIADRFGYIRTIIVIISSSGLFTLLMALSTSEFSLAVFLFLETSMIMGFFPLSFALTSKTAGADYRGPAVALVTFFGSISMALTPLLLGTIADHSNFAIGISGIGLIAMLSPLLFMAFR